MPPGAEALGGVLAANARAGSGTPGWDNRFCAGVWPDGSNLSNSQSAYASGCYGHDEPGIEFYSPHGGSGGNVTWNITLPTDRSPTENQSNLYSAIWFGLTLTDPLAWMDQCFLELQFYPDQTYSNPGPQDPNWTVNGQWIGAAVAWQIDAATGYEDACFYEPLVIGNYSYYGNSYLNMTQGDRISVTMGGWVGSPYGENLTIHDWNSGLVSHVNLRDPYGGFPLDPSYSTNTAENGLQWTPGGEYPVAFAFETGHAGNPAWPENNAYGGCSPGKPPATPMYPSVPCPSYDASSWANDTLTPWQISPPTFFNATSTDQPTQVAFTQDFGGIGLLSAIGLGACNGQIGSAWCTYPWYSYSCVTHAFNFGATDYPGVSADFGQFYEYSQQVVNNDLDLGYYPPANYSIPACGQPSYTVSLGTSGIPTGGSVYFLSHDYASGTIPGLLAGNYSIHPYVPAGAGFDRWITTGDVAIVGSSADEWASLDVLGDGSVSANFTFLPRLTSVTFDDVGTTVPGSVVVSAERTYTNGTPIATVPSGGSISLPAGIYGIQALPSPGSLFSSWSTSGSPVSLQPADFPTTLLDVLSSGGSATVTARDTPSGAIATMFVQVFGGGNVTFDTNTTDNFTALNVSVGTYAASAVANPGWTFSSWQFQWSAVMTDFAPQTNVTLEDGSSWLYAFFTQLPVYAGVTLNDSPTDSGALGLDAPFPVPSGSLVLLTPGVYPLYAFPSAGYAVGSWAVNSSAAAWINGTGADPNVEVNSSVTITASFLPRPLVNVTFDVSPASAGFVEFNGIAYANGEYNASAGAGTFFVDAYPDPGWELLNLSVRGTSNSITQGPVGYWVTLGGTSATLTATFSRVLVPISFAATSQTAVALVINGTTLAVGGTAWLPAGTYSISLQYSAAVEQFQRWAPSPGLETSNLTETSTTVTFSPFDAGTLVAVLDGPFQVVTFAASPAAFDLGASTILSVTTSGGTGPFGYSFSSLPPGCGGFGPTLTCTPTSTGTFSVALIVTDLFGLASAATATVQVNAAPSVSSFSASPSSLDIGMTTSFVTTVLGGTAPFAYLYSSLPSGCTTSDSATLECAPTSTGLTLVGVTATDADGKSATSALSVTVYGAPALSSLTATRDSVDVGLTTTLTATATGTGALSYSWQGLPTGCASADAATISCAPQTPGSATVVAKITDSVGGTATRSLVLTVAARPSLVASITPSALSVGGTAWINSTALGGVGGLTFGYSGLPSGCSSSNTSSLACAPTSPGAFTVTVTVTDALQQSANTTVTFTTTGPATHSGLSGATAEEIGALALVVVLAAVLLALWTRRRRPAESPREASDRPA